MARSGSGLGLHASPSKGDPGFNFETSSNQRWPRAGRWRAEEQVWLLWMGPLLLQILRHSKVLHQAGDPGTIHLLEF